MLTKEKYAKMPNKEVTEKDLPDFIAEFRAAKDNKKKAKDAEQNAKTQRAESSKGRTFNEAAGTSDDDSYDTENYRGTILDGQGGYIDWEWTIKLEETDNEEIYELILTGTERYQSFDYSQSGNLFFGEVYCFSFYESYHLDENRNRTIIMAGKATGKIEFMGKFAGSIEYKFPYYKETQNPDGSESDKYEGEIVIVSGKNRIKLSVDDWWVFLDLM
jgi:hypothetical protein